MRDVVDIQASVHTLISVPSPTALPMWEASKSLPARIPFHPWEAPFTNCTLSSGALWQYFPSMTLDRRQFGLVSMRHGSFASRAILKKRVRADCIILHKPTGNRLQVVAKLGTAVRTALSMTILPAEEMNLVDQLTAFTTILSIIDAKRSLFFLPKCSGRPSKGDGRLVGIDPLSRSRFIQG
ncbi:unnamed protein product [Brassica oleracea]